jgi:hypothetical protein
MHHAATISPATMPGSSSAQLDRSTAGDGVGDDVRGHERSGRDEASHLFGTITVDDALTREAAATVVFGHEERRRELGTSRPPGTVEPVRILGEGAVVSSASCRGATSGLLEELLVVGEAEVHRRA